MTEADKSRILMQFRGVGANFTYASLGKRLGVTGQAVRGYLTGFNRPKSDKIYETMDKIVTEFLFRRARGLDQARCGPNGEDRCDLKHQEDCGRGFSTKRKPSPGGSGRRRAG